jgi:hypothetical protein
VASFDAYDSHRHAQADFDPWDLQRCHPSTAIGHASYPCNLPKPPIVRGADLPDLETKLDVARAAGWQIQDRRSFIPPPDWRPADVNKADWREGHIFPKAELNGRSGYRDYLNNVWTWDPNERHWDVQLAAGGGAYVRVSHTGHVLA